MSADSRMARPAHTGDVRDAGTVVPVAVPTSRRAQARQRVLAYQQRLRIERTRISTHAHSAEQAQVRARLIAMQELGWQLLSDRQHPRGTRIGLIQIGPGGVLVIDIKDWHNPAVVEGLLFNSHRDCHAQVSRLQALHTLVSDAVAEIGLTPNEVVPVMIFAGSHPDLTQRLDGVQLLDEQHFVPWASARGQRLAPARIAQLTALLSAHFPETDPDGDPDEAACDTEPKLAPVSTLRRARFAAAAQIDQLETVALESAIASSNDLGPVDEWMTFLHPDQLRMVRCEEHGPASISGAAGTGKTVTALHRTAWLARSGAGKVLVTSFAKSLPMALSALYRQLSPETCGQVEFVELHAWAHELLSARGHDVTLDVAAAKHAFGRAWTRHGAQSALSTLGVANSYWADEIDHVIKARGITEFEQYAQLTRLDRGTELRRDERAAVWTVYRAYQDELTARGIHDLNDVLTLALNELSTRPLAEAYTAVVVDDVQDLNCLGLRLLAAVSENGRRLLLLGDGQQQLTPGGMQLAEAGMALDGPTVELLTNYRNSETIASAAQELVHEIPFVDLDAVPRSGARDLRVVRPGGQVERSAAQTLDRLRAGAVEQVLRLLESGADPCDIAVICGTNFEVQTYQRLLRKVGVSTVRLSEQRAGARAVKVGTVSRTKGLEFRHVVLPVHERPRALSRAESPEARSERELRSSREVFVAVTRARDSLWVGRIAA